MPNPWDNDPIVGARNVADQLGRPVIVQGPKPPAQPSPQTPAQAEKDVLEVQQLKQKLQKSDANTAAFREPVDEMINVIDKAAKAWKLSHYSGGMVSSPIGRTITQHIPGTPAKDLAGLLDTIRSNTAFKTLQQMRQQSPTGGAVGNVSDADMRLLGSTIASLDPAQSNDKFESDMHDVINSYGKVLLKLPGGKAAFEGWRKGWLGFDPNDPKQREAAIAGDKGISPDVQSILDKYGVK